MKPITSLRTLPEPAYILLGGLLPRDGKRDQRVLRSRDSILTFGHESFPILEFFSRLRGQSEAVEFAAEHGGSRNALDTLVTAGTLIRLPEDDESGVRCTLEPLCVRIIAPARVARDGETVLFQVNANQTVAVGPITSMVLTNDGVHSLKTSVGDVAQQWGLDGDHVWRAVIHDLTGVLMTGAGHLSAVSER